MKKILASIAFVAVCCSGLFAQSIKVTGDAINMTSEQFVFNLFKGGIGIYNQMNDQSVAPGPDVPFLSNTSGSVERIATPTPNYGNILPLLSNFMDLGSSEQKFRYLYINQITQQTNPKTTSDRRYKENIKNLENATEKIMALRSVTFDLKNTDNTSDTLELKNKVGFIA